MAIESIGCPVGSATEHEAELRYALYQAANVAAARVDLFRTYFTKLLRGRERKRGIKTKMHVKLAAKMLVIAWTLMKKRKYLTLII